MYAHQDRYAFLDRSEPLADTLRRLHTVLRERHPVIDRIALALYDPGNDRLKTYLYSSDDGSPLQHYETRLSECGSLMETLQQGRPRVVADMSLFAHGTRTHTLAIAAGGYRSSYTLPLHRDEALLGFLFFNSRDPAVFEGALLDHLDLLGHLISERVQRERDQVAVMEATVRSSLDVSRYRDPETAGHLGRMAHYARLIGRELAEAHGLDDDYIEHLFLFSPLHDLGKIAIPDEILLKPGRLSRAEFETMKGHAAKGREMIDRILAHYGLDAVAYVDMLRNIAEHHHEAIDGSGYPDGLTASEIPVEARIVAVADVFDALTSRRPYKRAWGIDQAFETLGRMAGRVLDAECVEVLIRNREEVEAIRERFRDRP